MEYMKQHILSALGEERDAWVEQLASLSDDEEQIAAQLLPSPWTVKDILAHLMAWQQRTRARCKAVLNNREPDFPKWPAGLDPNAEDVDTINAWIYESHRSRPWEQVYQDWKDGFQELLDVAQDIPESDLIASEKYTWLHGYSMAAILIATYDHHKEHLEKLQLWLEEHERIG
jgi:hypothetical protein